MLSSVISRRMIRNVYFDNMIEEYLPRLDPSDCDDKVLEFVKYSVDYEIRFSGAILPDEKGVVTIPGIDRVWRFILQASNGTVATAATDFVISRYLDHSIMVGQARKVIEAGGTVLTEPFDVFDAGRMAVFTDNSRSHERSQLGGRSTLRIVPASLEDSDPFPVDRVFPDLAHPDWSAIGRGVRVWVPHANSFRRSLIQLKGFSQPV
jgi:hypothetical protein